MKVVVHCPLSTQFKRSSKNKPEERQRVIVERLTQNDNCFVSCPEFTNQDITNNEFMKIVTDVHDDDFINFLMNSYRSYEQDGFNSDFAYTIGSEDDNNNNKIIGLICAVFVKNQDGEKRLKELLPLWKHIAFYATDNITPIFEHSKDNIFKSAFASYEMAKILMNSENCFGYNYGYVVASSPGHHAGKKFYGGYCFVNNAMIGTMTFLTRYNRVCILDLDFHAGDGTEDIVRKYNSDNKNKRIRSISVHMNPIYDYPHYRGINLDIESNKKDDIYNLTMEPHCSKEDYMKLLTNAIDLINDFGPTAIVLAFGADTHYKDPEVVKPCSLHEDDYIEIGKYIGSCVRQNTCKLLITQEGGYYIEAVPTIVENLLNGISS